MITHHFIGSTNKAYNYEIRYKAPEKNPFWPYENGNWFDLNTNTLTPFVLVEDSFENGEGVWRFKGSMPTAIGTICFGTLDDLVAAGGFNCLFGQGGDVYDSYDSTITDVTFPDGVSLQTAFLRLTAAPMFCNFTTNTCPIFDSFTANCNSFVVGAVLADNLYISARVQQIIKRADGNPYANITVDGDNAYYNSGNNCNVLIETNTNKLILSGNNCTIPNGVTTIDFCAFNGRTVPDLPSSVQNFESGAFYCSTITNMTIPETVTSLNCGTYDGIPFGMFGLANIGSLTLPSTLQVIGNNCFCYSKGMSTITIPSSVASIGDFAFLYSAITNINYLGTVEQWESITKGYNLCYHTITVTCTDDTVQIN